MKNLHSALKFHHIGIAVRTIAKAKKFYEALGYSFSKRAYDPLQNVHISVGSLKKAPTIELIARGKGVCPIDKYLIRSDHAMYHLCYETSDLAKALKDLTKKVHLVCVSDPKHATVFKKKKVSFYYSDITGLIEIIERP